MKNNPIINIDPSGHITCRDDDYECLQKQGKKPVDDYKRPRGSAQLSNVPLEDQPNTTACGPASVAMVLNYQNPANPVTSADVASTASNLQVYDDPNTLGNNENKINSSDYRGVSPAGMTIIGNHYSEAPIMGRVMDEESAKIVLYNLLANNMPVIVDVTTDMQQPSVEDDNSHYVVVTGIDFDTGTVTYNDPNVWSALGGPRNGRTVYWNTFWAAWSSNPDVNRTGQGFFMALP